MKKVNLTPNPGETQTPEYEERIIQIDRVSRTVKGGRRIRFRVVTVVGDKNGKVGVGVAKAAEVQRAIQSSFEAAKRKMFTIPLVHFTIPHETRGSFSGSYVILKPAREGTSVIAGGPLRALAEVAGIKNIVTKSLGSSNKLNTIRAAQLALQSFRSTRPAPPSPTKALKELTPQSPKPLTTKKRLHTGQNSQILKEKREIARSAKKTGKK